MENGFLQDNRRISKKDSKGIFLFLFWSYSQIQLISLAQKKDKKLREELQRNVEFFWHFLQSSTKFYEDTIARFQAIYNLKLDGSDDLKTLIGIHIDHLFLTLNSQSERLSELS